MPFPLLAAMLISAAATGATAYGQSRSAAKQAKTQKEANAEALALEESQLNPFRGANAQARSMLSLDRSMNRTPVTTTTNARGFNQLSGGGYQMSPEVMQWLAELRARIASGAAANPAVGATAKPQVGNLNQPLPGPPVPPPPTPWRRS